MLNFTIVPAMKSIFEAGTYTFQCKCLEMDLIKNYGALAMAIFVNNRVFIRSNLSSIILKVDGTNTQPVTYVIRCYLRIPNAYGEMKNHKVVVFGRFPFFSNFISFQFKVRK